MDQRSNVNNDRLEQMCMSNVFKNFLNSLKLTEDEDDYDDYISEFEEREKKRVQKQEQKQAQAQARKMRSELEDEEDEEGTKLSFSTETRKERAQRMEKSPVNKVVPIRTTNKGFEVCIMKPTSFEDSQDICDMLLSGRAAVINLEGFDVELAQRIMDFISGAVYAMNGKLHQISSYIFIISPDTVDISGDFLDLIPEDGFEVPTLNKEF